MFKPPITNTGQKRTIRPIYAQHQATAWAGLLDPEWDKRFDILPGMVMVRKGPGEVFAPFTGEGDAKPFGLGTLFLAPLLGIDEITPTGTNTFTVWTGGNNAAFEVLAPAFDETATWDNPEGGRVLLYPSTKEGQVGKLTPEAGDLGPEYAVAELLEVIDARTILISLNRHA